MNLFLRTLYVILLIGWGLLYIAAGMVFLVVGVIEEMKELVMRLLNKKKVC